MQYVWLKLGRSFFLFEIFTQSQKLLLATIVTNGRLNLCSMGAHEYGDQISDRPDVDGITQSPRHTATDLDGLINSCFKN